MWLVFKDRTIVAHSTFGAIALFLLLISRTGHLSATPIIYIPSNQAAEDSLDLRVTTHLGDDHVFYEDDTVSFLVSINKDAFLLLIYENAEHSYFQIYPNSANDNGFLPAGGYRPIPGMARLQGFRVTPPFGKEKLWAFASSTHIPTFLGKTSRDGFITLKAKIETIREKFFSHCKQKQAMCTETSTTFFTTSGEDLPKLHASLVQDLTNASQIYAQMKTTNNTYSQYNETGGCFEKDSNKEKFASCGNSTSDCSIYDRRKHTKCIKL